MTATGIISKPLDLFADMLAASSTFQTFAGAANATEAKAFIELWERAGGGTGNGCIVQHTGISTSGPPSDPVATGTLSAVLEFDQTRSDFEDSFAATVETVMNTAAAIDAEMRAARLATPYLYPDLRDNAEIQWEAPEPRDEQSGSGPTARYVWRVLLEYEWEGLP